MENKELYVNVKEIFQLRGKQFRSEDDLMYVQQIDIKRFSEKTIRFLDCK